MVDLLVIGAGLSGLFAAITAARAGLKVRLIAKGLGATHWAAGTVDVLGYAPAAVAAPGLVQRPLQAFSALPAAHPYHLIGADGVRAALNAFQTLSQEVGLPYIGDPNGQNLLLPSPVGAARPTLLAPLAQSQGDLERRDPLLFVGFSGLRDVYPELLAANLRKQGFQARAAFVPLPHEQQDRNTIQLARGLDDPTRRARLASEIRRIARPGERIGLPAVLGLHDHAQALADLQAQTGAVIFEFPTLPPSAPGMRLHLALRRQLEQMGATVEIGMEGIGFHGFDGFDQAQDGIIAWVETATSTRPLRQRAGHFLLATGGILGGGFNSNHLGRVWEVIFDLPLTVPQERHLWLQPRFVEGQPVFCGGVMVNEAWQPAHADGTPIYRNLWAAGGLLAGGDYIQERSLEGVALASGHAAAQRLSQTA